MTRFKILDFKPLFGLWSKHLQMIVSAYSFSGKAPPSESWLVDVGNGDKLSCEVSTPPNWNANGKTVLLIHGLGGSHRSRYMVRMARKLFEIGVKSVRINLRNCGSGVGLSKLPYGAGNSQDVKIVIEQLKKQFPDSEIVLIGFSLGGNTALKLAGELGSKAEHFIKKVIAVCPPLDLEQTVQLIQEKKNWVYHRYYLKSILRQSSAWLKEKVSSIYEFDDKITGPLWGFSGAKDYYEKCSSIKFIGHIRCETHIIFAEDDPFISIEPLEKITIPSQVDIWISKKGSHIGFIGFSDKAKGFQWLDNLLLDWV